MKKLVLVLCIVLAAVFSAQASEFTAGGSYRMVVVDDDPGAGQTSNYWRQRFRVAFNWKVNDNVSTQLRGDFAEFTWGDGYRPEAGTDTLMVDRAFTTIKSGALTLKVGQQAGAWGLGTMWSDQFQGIHADVALDPITIKLLYVKESEGGAAGNTTTDEAGNDDTDVYAIAAAYATDAFTGQLSFGTLRQKSNAGAAADITINGYSLTLIAPIGDMKLMAEGAIYGGDNGSTTDYTGTQLFIGVDAKLSDALSAGAGLIWADGADATNEDQITELATDTVFSPFDYKGALAALGNGRGSFGGETAVFDVSGQNKGTIGFYGTVAFMPTEAVTLYGTLGYAEPNDNDDVTNLDSKFFAVGSIDYAWMPAVTLSAGVGYVSPDYSDNTNDDAAVEYIARLGVSF